MSTRKLLRTARFEGELENLAKKHRRLPEIIEFVVQGWCDRGPSPQARLLNRVGGRPVYKERLPLNGAGKQGGARINYCCTQSSVVAVSIYAKNEKEPSNDIVLRALGSVESRDSNDDGPET